MTTSIEARCLESFPTWLTVLAHDVRTLAELVASESSEAARRVAAASLSYLVKPLDWTNEGVQELGLFEDACIMRALVAALPAEERAAEASGLFDRFATEAVILLEFLGTEDASRLERHVQILESRSSGGSNVENLLSNPEAVATLVNDTQRWADRYSPPVLLRDAKDLLKLKAFLSARLAANVTVA